MNKFKLSVLVLMFLVLLSACTSKEDQQAIEAVENAISEIKTDDLNASTIADARDLYDDLAENLKEKVGNYQVLIDAEKEYESQLIDTIQSKIIGVSKIESPTKEQIDELIASHEQLTEDQQSKLNGYEEAIKLRRCEIIAIQAVNQFKIFFSAAKVEDSRICVYYISYSLHTERTIKN